MVIRFMKTPLPIPTEIKERRFLLLTWVRQYKVRLVRAYISGDQTRINKNKLSLARHLKELAQSPEMGPKPKFQWGHRLEVIYKHGFDKSISWADAESVGTDPYKAAVLLERSIDYA